jgi:lipopolysaccharide assembly outer membrane protein LptD (OstA)
MRHPQRVGWSAAVFGITCLLVAMAAVGSTADDEGRVFLSSDTQNATEDLWIGEGNVHIIYQDVEIRCERAEYDRSTGDITASGGVVVDRGPSRFTAEEARFNLETKTGIFRDATAFVDPMYTFSGQEIEKLDENLYRLRRARFTSCEVDDAHPPWSFYFHKAVVRVEGLGRFTSTAMKIQGVPVFYLPYMVWPIKQDRATGLLFPNIGYSDRRGFNLGLPLFVPLGRSYDVTVLADYYSEDFYGLGTRWRWAPVQGAAGEINLYGLWDELNEIFQWQVFGFHNQDDVLGFRLLAQVESLSDIDFWQDFDRSFDANTRRDLYSFVYLTRSFGPYSLNIRADHRETFLTSSDVVLSQIPEIEIRSGSTAIGRSPIYLNLIGSLNYLSVDRGGDLQAEYGRADLFPTLSYTLPGPPWLSVTPRLGGRFTHYTAQLAEDRQSYVDEGLDRVYATAGVDLVGPSFSRVFEGGFGPYGKVKHLIEPRLEYRFLTTTTDVSRIPIFDEVDSTPRDANFVRMVLANRLLGRASSGVGTREIASLEFIQDLSFDEPLTTGADGDTSQLGPFGMALRLTPIPGTGFDARLSYDLLYKNLRSTSLAASLQRPLGSLALTWYESYNPRDGERTSSQVRSLIGFRKAGFPLDVSFQLAYDIVNREIGDQRYRVGWQGSCWNISASYRDTRIGAFPTREFLIVIGLKGVGALPEIRGSLGGY